MRTFPEEPFMPNYQDDQAAGGDDSRKALDELVERLYSKLKPLAARVRWRDASPTLNATALVQEAYLKLLNSKDLTSKPHDEVLAIFAHVFCADAVCLAARWRQSSGLSRHLVHPAET